MHLDLDDGAPLLGWYNCTAVTKLTNRKSDEDEDGNNNQNEGKLGRNYNVDNNADVDEDGKSNDEDEMTRSDQVSSVEGGGEAGGTEHFLQVLVVPTVGYQ